METKETSIKRHQRQSIHYFENALKFIEAGDAEKASEFLWGSMTQALKALAASRGIKLKSHRDMRDYALEVARDLSDDSVRLIFDKAQSLHSNFYECGLLLEDVMIAAKDVKLILDRLLSLIPQEN
ncbi:MAG: hypothetical protein HYX79_03955 [Chloroflexi bacterium]|nr:hypothetical protein [Chloroflexota bacterium]